MQVTVQRTKGATFIAKGDSNHWVVLDSDEKFGGSNAASRPMEMLLIALGGCTAMDVAALINKMRTPVSDFRVEISAERQEEHPRVFTKIHLTFIFTGENLNKANIAKAVKLSQEKYCSISAMLSNSVEISYAIQYTGA